MASSCAELHLHSQLPSTPRAVTAPDPFALNSSCLVPLASVCTSAVSWLLYSDGGGGAAAAAAFAGLSSAGKFFNITRTQGRQRALTPAHTN